jgi:hypothetical protein
VPDRLLHHSTVVSIQGEGYRLKDKRRAGLIRLPGGGVASTDRLGSMETFAGTRANGRDAPIADLPDLTPGPRGSTQRRYRSVAVVSPLALSDELIGLASGVVSRA